MTRADKLSSRFQLHSLVGVKWRQVVEEGLFEQYPDVRS
jgi:hypothetical protein